MNAEPSDQSAEPANASNVAAPNSKSEVNPALARENESLAPDVSPRVPPSFYEGVMHWVLTRL